MANKKITWQELKEFCNALPDDVLHQAVLVQYEDGGLAIEGAVLASQDYLSVDNEGLEPREMYLPEGQLHYLTTEQDIDVDDICVRKGDPFLTAKGGSI